MTAATDQPLLAFRTVLSRVDLIEKAIHDTMDGFRTSDTPHWSHAVRQLSVDLETAISAPVDGWRFRSRLLMALLQASWSDGTRVQNLPGMITVLGQEGLLVQSGEVIGDALTAAILQTLASPTVAMVDAGQKVIDDYDASMRQWGRDLVAIVRTTGTTEADFIAPPDGLNVMAVWLKMWEAA